MTSLILLSDWQKSQIEFWRPIQGFPGYDVSSFGRVRSYWHRKGGRDGFQIQPSLPPSILKFGVHRQGYLKAYLYRTGQRRVIIMVHRLVAQAFIANPAKLPEVNHLTALKSDCRMEALEWSTRHANQRHAWKVGLITADMVRNGLSRTVNSDFSERQIIEIRKRRAGGESNSSLAVVYGVTDSCICNIVTGKTFKRTGGPRTRACETWKLSPDNVRMIRKLISTRAATQTEIARQFNIDPSNVSRIGARQRYAYVSD